MKPIYKMTKTVYVEADSPGEARFTLQKMINGTAENTGRIKDANSWKAELSSNAEYQEEAVP